MGIKCWLESLTALHAELPHGVHCITHDYSPNAALFFLQQLHYYLINEQFKSS